MHTYECIDLNGARKTPITSTIADILCNFGWKVGGFPFQKDVFFCFLSGTFVSVCWPSLVYFKCYFNVLLKLMIFLFDP